MSQMELIEAIKSGNRAAVQQAIDAGVELNSQDDQGWTPLNWAAGSGHIEIVELLLERGADPLATGRDLRTPQMIALAAGHADVVQRLRAAEAKAGATQASTRNYCTAYYLGDLRRYPGWTSDADDLKDEDVVFLHQDYTVTRSMWAGEDIIFNDITEQWKSFCNNELRFAVPDSLDLIAKPAQAAQTAA